MRNLFFVLICILSVQLSWAQHAVVTGFVSNEKEERLPYATLQWQNSIVYATADSSGNFTIKARKKLDTLVVTYTGHKPAKVAVEPHEKMLWIVLAGVKELEAFTLKEARPDNFVSTLDSRHVEQITSCELRKAPCCNLAGSFETNNSVDVNYGNAVTGATEIQMLGLRGIYTQMTIQKRPAFYGLGYPFALEFYPGTWLDGISISKGASSVEQGAQSLTGQINVNMLKPSEDKAVFVNLYQNTLNTFEANLHLNKKINPEWSVGTYLHYDNMQNVQDHDKDGFANMPQKRQLNGQIRLLHQGKTWYNQNTIHLLRDNRSGGQIVDKSLVNPWSVKQEINRVDFSGSLGYLGFDKIYNSLAVIYGATHHTTDEAYGNNTHVGTQNSYYANAIFATIIKNTNNRLNLGSSLQYDIFKEKVNDVTLDRKDIMPGVYAEYSYNHPKAGTAINDWGLILGLRNDYHNRFGNFVVPRMNVKYNFNENHILRASAGRGWRVANIIPENLNVLASNRQVNISNDLKPEDGWNVGVNYSGTFEINERKASFNADVYRTQFVNQIIVDQDRDFKSVSFYNLDGSSYSNSIMGVFTYNVFNNFDAKIGYKYNDVKTTINQQLTRMPMIPTNRWLLTLDYKTNDQNWLFHGTMHYVGQQRLPSLQGLPDQYLPHHYTGKSSPYININAQITRKLGRWEVYAGGENLTNYTQHSPIIAYNEPYSNFFNASQIWGPLMGIRGFVGLRFSIDQDGKEQIKSQKLSKHPKVIDLSFEVKGDCGMCKTRIEKTALETGAIEAIWSSEIHILQVKFDEKSISREDIQAAIAKAGHDAGIFRADNKTYEALPACCHYKRD
ncbi:MAG: TonB-dependent receptor domain-containing protein [Saprospiraceae bacterium]